MTDLALAISMHGWWLALGGFFIGLGIFGSVLVWTGWDYVVQGNRLEDAEHVMTGLQIRLTGSQRRNTDLAREVAWLRGQLKGLGKNPGPAPTAPQRRPVFHADDQDPTGGVR